MVMDDLTCFLNTVLEDTEGGGVCDLSCISERVDYGRDWILTMKAASLSLCFSAFARRSSKSRLPSARFLTDTTFKPAMCADCADVNYPFEVANN